MGFKKQTIIVNEENIRRRLPQKNDNPLYVCDNEIKIKGSYISNAWYCLIDIYFLNNKYPAIVNRSTKLLPEAPYAKMV